MFKECKICKDTCEEILNPLISPCRCRGSIGYVHRKCLTDWVTSSKNSVCPECNVIYSHVKYYNGFFSKNITSLLQKYIDNAVIFYTTPLLAFCTVMVFLHFVLFEFILEPLFYHRFTIYIFCYYVIINKCLVFFVINVCKVKTFIDNYFIFDVFFNLFYLSYQLKQSYNFGFSIQMLQIYNLVTVVNYVVYKLLHYQLNKTYILYVNYYD